MNAQMTREQFNNLLFLRDTVIPWMEKHPERVALNTLGSMCGTYRCLAGWYGVMRYGSLDERIEKQVAADFGREVISIGDELFGIAAIGTLADRKSRLEQIIAEHQHLFADKQESALPFPELMRQLQTGELEAMEG